MKFNLGKRKKDKFQKKNTKRILFKSDWTEIKREEGGVLILSPFVCMKAVSYIFVLLLLYIYIFSHVISFLSPY